jgi:hypothetical protein
VKPTKRLHYEHEGADPERNHDQKSDQIVKFISPIYLHFGFPSLNHLDHIRDFQETTIHQTICVSGYSRTVRPPSWYTSKLKHRQLAAEGIVGRMRDFEEDHLIPLSVGGNPRDERNLWPEPRFGVWNAEKKDQLEDIMHRGVYDGSITLRAAQDAFRGNWTVVYRRYVER